MASKEDLAKFRDFQEKDPASKVCFECGAHAPQWCAVFHGLFICLECSGVHRSLGTHLSFVRSLTMDGWQPEKLQLMMLGGNGKAKAFFKAKGIDGLPIREKYATDAALMYKDKLQAEAEGRVFKESEWKPPEKKQTYVSQAQNTARPEPGFGGTKYGGIGAPSAPKQAESWVDTAALAKGWSTFSSALTDAASVAAAKAKEAADAAQKQAQATMANASVSAPAASGWGSTFSSWAKSMTAATAPQEDSFADALANLDLKKTGQYTSMSSEQVVGSSATLSAQQATPPPRSPVSPEGNGDWTEDSAGDGDTGKPGSPDSFNSGAGARRKGGLGARPVKGGLGAKRIEKKAE
eukprot:EG_transcript_9256